MSYYLLFYSYADDYLERRGEFRRAHFEHATKYVESKQLLLAGAYANPADGAALVFRVDDPKIVEDFAKVDPYVAAGLVTGFHVRQWSVVAGCDCAEPLTL
jgi:uncharacterized protein YciI